jgi:hypothetical protein
VRVAILDTGIDVNDEALLAFKKRIKGRKSWVDDADDGDDNITDEFGHGTHTTALLCSIAPEADIYIARVAKGKTLHKPEYIAKVRMHPMLLEICSDVILGYQMGCEMQSRRYHNVLGVFQALHTL